MSARLLGAVLRANIIYGGRYRIDGAVTGVTGSRKVRLYDRAGGQLIAETWSDSATGAYAFTGIPGLPQEYIAIAIDYLDVWNCAVADRPPLSAM